MPAAEYDENINRTIPYYNEFYVQTFDVVKDVTGVDMADIMKSNAIQAKTDRNINVTGDDDINVGAVVK